MPQSDTSPAVSPYLITPNDSTVLTPTIRAFSVAVGGNVKVTKFNGTVETWAVPAGIMPCGVQIIWSAGTTATGFVGFP